MPAHIHSAGQEGYCFAPELDKVGETPICPAGYTLNKKPLMCFKSAAALSCSSSKQFLMQTADKYQTCGECTKHNSVFDKKSGKCEVPCKKGYSEVVIKGTKYCV